MRSLPTKTHLQLNEIKPGAQTFLHRPAPWYKEEDQWVRIHKQAFLLSQTASFYRHGLTVRILEKLIEEALRLNVEASTPHQAAITDSPMTF